MLCLTVPASHSKHGNAHQLPDTQKYLNISFHNFPQGH